MAPELYKIPDPPTGPLMKLEVAIRARRAIRKYLPRSVPRTVILELLDLAMHAPSSMNGQPWHFIIVRDPSIKRALAQIKNRYCPPEKKTFKADFIQKATILFVCIDEERSHERSVENAVLAASMFMLAAHSRGMGTVYMAAYQAGKPGLEKEISELLKLPKNIRPITMIPFGYPAEKPPKKEFRELKEITHFECY
jgi:nitroreductase